WDSRMKSARGRRASIVAESVGGTSSMVSSGRVSPGTVAASGAPNVRPLKRMRDRYGSRSTVVRPSLMIQPAAPRCVRRRRARPRSALDVDTRTATLPELAGREPGTLRHAGQLGPDHPGVHGGLADPGAVAAVGPCDDVLPTHQLRVASDPLRHQLGVLD